MITVVKCLLFSNDVPAYALKLGDKYACLNGKLIHNSVDALFENYKLTQRPIQKRKYMFGHDETVLSKYNNFKEMKERNIEYFI